MFFLLPLLHSSANFLANYETPSHSSFFPPPPIQLICVFQWPLTFRRFIFPTRNPGEFFTPINKHRGSGEVADRQTVAASSVPFIAFAVAVTVAATTAKRQSADNFV